MLERQIGNGPSVSPAPFDKQMLLTDLFLGELHLFRHISINEYTTQNKKYIYVYIYVCIYVYMKYVLGTLISTPNPSQKLSLGEAYIILEDLSA